MKKDWTKKCTCENFQQNEGCEHIGDKILEEVGLGVDDKDCPDCLPYDGCAKHYIKDGDRHDRLKGALTPFGQLQLAKKKLKDRLFYAAQIDYDENCAMNNLPTPDDEADKAIEDFIRKVHQDALSEFKKELREKIKKIQILADQEQALETDLALQNLLEEV